MNEKIFLLGDSRTGTTSLHRLFLDYGLKSVHYFIDEVVELANRDGLTKHSYQHFREFVDSSGFEAFTDYPTRVYFRDLQRDYPNSYFILSTRKDIETWRKSMLRFFSDREDVQTSIDHLSNVYHSINTQIETLFKGSKRFISICIDDGNEINSKKIADFMGFNQVRQIMKLNAAP